MEDIQKIIEGCIRNDRYSQELLYKEFYASLFCLCRRIFSNDQDAVEALNDGMLKVFKNISDFRYEKGKIFNWLYTIVRNTAIDNLRKRKDIRNRHPLEEWQEAIVDSDKTGNPLQMIEGKDIYVLLDELSPATRTVCALFYLEGYSIRDISESLSISEGTVKWHCSEARKKLRYIFERHFKNSS